MKKIIDPQRKDWLALAKRPVVAKKTLDLLVDEIFAAVKQEGDSAVIRYNQLYDKNSNPIRKIQPEIMEQASDLLPEDLKAAIRMAAANIEHFHTIQAEAPDKIETTKGVTCWRESRAIENIGIYIPGGSAPLFSTVLMLGIPARLAGCKTITLCTPANAVGLINPAILYAASISGVSDIFGIGGIQAIAAMALGTESIPKADKIFGPGNQYVTAAKQKAQQIDVAIDMPAGPSEVLIIADKTCDPKFVAADLLSQAEHGPDSQVMLLSNDEEVINRCLVSLEKQLTQLPRATIATEALQHSRAIVFSNIEDCISFSNLYAPEHLILAVDQPLLQTSKIINAGSVFLGNYSCESAGDYASGTNHTLPTNGYARSYSGVSLDSFLKKITFQELTADGIQNIGPGIELMADAEQLWGHKNAISLRLKSLSNV
ncbi:MAG: histidinol dehydrogenase [Taibaiella sp.]|jgi:histidinol dehydrogenase